MKKTVLFILILTMLCVALSIPCLAQNTSYHWYCKHVKEHAQPQIEPNMVFIEELDGYYLDHECGDEKVIYLTFDVGYENGNVAKTLDVLKEENVSAAFFILGNLITHDTELVKRMVADGHTVCNHSVQHKDMTAWSDADFLQELHDLEALYKEHIGSELASFYRPPEGNFSKQNLACAKANGYKTIFWSFAYPDWDNQKQMSKEKAKQIILENVHNGEVMLLHPTSATNAAILGEVIRELKSQGYRFGTLDELTGGEA
ncbi:MAG: polysaccharide deacetylase family protein [Clostridia bacterium]|nr:polysaccharide deacetylase family protein [Clostridia bacterium]